MKSIRVRLYEFMKVQGLAESTILEYLKQYDAVKRTHPDFDDWQSEQCISFLSEIEDPIYRSHKRNLVLKVHRDLLGKQLNIPFIKKPVRLQQVYTHEEVRQIFSCIVSCKHKAIAALLYTEGFRVGEVVNIRLKDIGADRCITIRSTKNGRDYKKYLDASTVQYIKDYWQWLRMRQIRLQTYLFEGCDHNQYSRRSIQQVMSQAIERSGLDKRGSCHVFRRSNATFKIENGWSLQHIAASLNNTVKTVSKHYALVRPSYLNTLAKPAL